MTVNGTATVNINSGIGLVVGGVYPLVSNWGSGSFNLVAQPPGVQGGLSVSSGTLVYTVTAVSDIWSANSPGGNWDVGVTANWAGNAVNNSPLDTYRDGDAVAFTDAVTGPNTVTNAANVAPSSIVVGNSSTAYTIASDGTHNIGGSGTLTKSGSAALTLSGNNSYSGGTTLSAGQLNINNGGSSSGNSAIGTGPLTIAGSSSIDNTSSADVTLLPAIAQNWNASFTYVGSANNLNLGSGAVTLGISPTVTVGGNALTVGGAISATSYGLTKAGAGTLVLAGANAYTGTNTVSAGTLKAGVASVANTSGAFGNNSAVALANTAGATLDITGFNTQIGSLTGGGTNGGNVTLGTAALTVGADNTSPAAYAGVISDNSGGGSLTIIGNGTLTLAGASTYGGGTTLNGGTLVLGASSTTNSSGTVTSGPLGTNTLTLSGGTLNCGTNTTIANSIYVTPSTTTAVFSPNVQSILTGAITGSGTISNNYSSASTLAIQGDISGFTGTFSYYLNSGGDNFRFNGGSANNQNGSQAHFVLTGVTSGRAFGIGGTGFATFQMGDLSGTGGVINNMNVNGSLTTLQVGALNTSTTFGGIIIDNSSDKTALTKVGTGTLTLSGASTYTGNTTISAGTLALSGSGLITNTVSIVVASNAIFDVSGLTSTFTLAQSLSNQTLSNSAPGAVLNGTNNCSTGKLSLVYDGVNPSFLITNGGMTISSATSLKVNKIGTALLPGAYKVIAKATAGNVGLVAGTVPGAVTVTGGQPGAGTPSLSIVNGELYLTVGGASSVSYTGSSFTYNGLAQTPAIAITGSTGATTTNYVGTGATTYASVNPPTGAGTYYVSNTVAADANYFGANTSQAFSIIAAPASVTADAKSKTYGTVNPTLTATVTGQVIGGDTINFSLSTDAGQYSAVGVSNIFVMLGSNPNYSVLATNGTLTINQASTFVGASSTENPSGYQDSISFTATLPSDATGGVVFSSTNGPISTNSVSSGSATSLSITALPRGTNLITVTYLGDVNYLGSTSNLNQIVTNHPPVASVMTVTRTAGLALMISLSDMATNWSDVDGDTVELTGANMQSTNGVNLIALNWTTNLDGSILTTTNAFGFIGYSNSPNVADQIRYSISDGQGGTNIGYVNIVIQSSVTGTNSITQIITGDPTLLTAYGIPGYSYLTERSTNLTTWVDIATNTVGTNGLISVTDSFSDLGGSPPSAAYYRLKWQP